MLSATAGDIMTRDVITVRRGTSVDEALTMMAEHNVSGLPVVDADGILLGIITESDVLLKGQALIPGDAVVANPLHVPKPDAVDEAYRRARASLVEDAMTTKVLVFEEESLVVDIARAMIERAVNRVPIVRNRRVVGIVSRKDIVRAMAQAANGLSNRDTDQPRTGEVIEL